MRRANETVVSDGISVKIGRLGSGTLEFRLPQDTTIGEALSQANIFVEGQEKIMVNGEEATKDDILDSGDIVSLITPKHAG